MARFCIFLILLSAATASAQLRTWTDVSGKHHFRAELTGNKEGTVSLKGEDGRIVTLPIEKLCEADRRYISRQSDPANRPATSPAATNTDSGPENASEVAPARNRKYRGRQVLVVAEDGPAALWDGSRWRSLDYAGTGITKILWCTIDSRNRCWLSGNGLLCLDGKQLRRYGAAEGLPREQLAHVFEDTQGRIWVCSFGGGIAILEGEQWRTLTDRDGLHDNQANACAEDGNGRIWIGCDLGASVFENGAFDKDVFGPQLDGLLVKSADGDPSGWIGLGCIGAMVVVRPDLTVTIITPNEGLPQRTPQATYIDSRGRIWAGTWGGGVVQIERATCTVSKELALAEAAHVRRICEDSESRIWVGALEGLWRLSGDRWERISTPPPIEQVAVVATVSDLVAEQLLDRWGRERSIGR